MIRACKQRTWSKDNCALLLRMKAQGASAKQMAAHFRTSEHGVRMKLLRLRTAAAQPKRPKPVVADAAAQKSAIDRKGERWSDEENAQLIARGDAGEKLTDIGVLLNRTRWACKVQYTSLKRGTAAAVPSIRTTREAKALAAKEAREAIACHQTLTAAFFGDPLPGRSALDQRRSVEPANVTLATELPR